MGGCIIIQVYDRVLAESTQQFRVLADPPITSLGYHEYDVLVGKDRVDGDEEWDEAVVELMEEVSGVPTGAEYQGGGLVLHLTFCDWWA